MSLKTSQAINIYGGPLFTYKEAGNGRIKVNPEWVNEFIVWIDTPIGKVQCHKYVAENLDGFLTEAASYIDKGDFAKAGGCFVPRHIRWDSDRPISLHSLGIPIDFNVWLGKDGYGGSMNFGSNSYQPQVVIAIAAKFGYEWGGNWKSVRDGMHSQPREDFKIGKIVPVKYFTHVCKAKGLPLLRYKGIGRITSHNREVWQVQEKLNSLGYRPLSIDGLYGNGTRKMVARFQKDRKLVVDGIVGFNTYHALGW